jgi:hypothetical protein
VAVGSVPIDVFFPQTTLDYVGRGLVVVTILTLLIFGGYYMLGIIMVFGEWFIHKWKTAGDE